MADQPNQMSASLSDISHLFLTELRQRQTGGASAPRRRPPVAASIDITPGEFTARAGSGGAIAEGLKIAGEDSSSDDHARPRLSAVLAQHLGHGALQRVRQYASHLASSDGRVGLIEIGDDGLRLTCFDPMPDGEAPGENLAAQLEPVDGVRIAEALEEMSWDVQRWVLFVAASGKSESARNLLGTTPHWTLMVSASDEGIVSGYRALKSLCDAGPASLSLVVLDAEDGAAGEMVHRKLAGASRQFLDRPIEAEKPMAEAEGIAEHVVLWCRAAGGTTAHWTAVMELAGRSVGPGGAVAAKAAEPSQEPVSVERVEEEAPIAEPIPMKIVSSEETTVPAAARADVAEVVDLPTGADASAILAAVLRSETQWVACPVKPPMCAGATVAVDREGRLTLIAIGGGGLAELASFSRGYAWMVENRPLLRMAVPQMKIDAGALPRLAIFVDRADAAAEQLGAIMQNGNVTVRSYQRLRWGGKTGLLVAA